MSQRIGRWRSFSRSSAFKKILIWFALFIGFTLLMLPFGLRRVSEWQQREQRLLPVFPLTSGQVAAITATGQGEHVALTRTAQGWQFTSPADARVNQEAVQTFLGVATHWVPVRRYKVLDALSQQGEVGFGFKTQRQEMALTADTGKVWRLILGDQEPITSFYYARQGESQTILLMDVSEEIDLLGLTYRLRDHRLFKEPLQDIHKISYREGSSVITLELDTPAAPAKSLPFFGDPEPAIQANPEEAKPRTWNITYPYYFPADEKTISQLLPSLAQWEVKAFVEESVGARTNLAQYGLNDPHAGLVLHRAGHRFPLELIFGQPGGMAGPVFLKTNQVSKIYEIAPETLEALQLLLNNASSRKLVFFLDEIASIEFLTNQRRINVWLEDKIWRASSVDQVTRSQEMKSKRPEVPQAVFFKGEEIIAQVQTLEYLDTLSEDNPFFEAYRQAKEVLKIRFARPSGNLREVFHIYQAGAKQDVWFLKRQSDDTVYLIQRRAINALLRSLNPRK